MQLHDVYSNLVQCFELCFRGCRSTAAAFTSAINSTHTITWLLQACLHLPR